MENPYYVGEQKKGKNIFFNINNRKTKNKTNPTERSNAIKKGKKKKSTKKEQKNGKKNNLSKNQYSKLL